MLRIEGIMKKLTRVGIVTVALMMLTGASVFSGYSDQGPEVMIAPSGLQVSGGPGAASLSLRIVGPDGQAVCDLNSAGETLNWTVFGELPDGQYSYEVRQGIIPRRSREDGAGSGEVNVPVWRDSGGFLMQGGNIVLPTEGESGSLHGVSFQVQELLAQLADFLVTPAYADVVHNDDVIITGGECVGFDCAIDGSQYFSADDLILKENSISILFDDSSSTSGFPANDWQILINSTLSGGLSYFSVKDVTAGVQPFTIEAGAPANSLYVEDYGRVGLGTSTPYVELHIRDSDTPTVRLEQDGTGGWTPQTWDLAGNESNFFIRDVTNGSKLPFRIQPGTPSSTLTLKNTGYVGIGTWSPEHTLQVEGDALITGNLELGSSRSLKQNIHSLALADASTTLAALQPVRFRYKTTPEEESLGFIAEDVPDLVATRSRKSISTMDVVAVLTKVVQDQQATIARLEDAVATLQNQLQER